MDDSLPWPRPSLSDDSRYGNGNGESTAATDRARSLVVTPAVALDEMFSLLSHRDRRYALYYLYDRDGDLPLSDLVAYVVASRADDAVNPVPDAVPEDEFERFYRTFLDTHLPKLALAGVVDYHVDDDWVLLSANTDVVDERLLVHLLTVAARFEVSSASN